MLHGFLLAVWWAFMIVTAGVIVHLLEKLARKRPSRD